jgi:queuine tRNA-ribosyltransferase
MSDGFQFEVSGRAGHARRGRILTPRGVIDTPAFMPVGTAASIKGLTPDQVETTGTQIILANTYHLMLRPGAEVVEQLGGLHRFMNWKRPILTDSGGYQVYSLAKLRTIDDDGVSFRSHLDGTMLRLDAESSIRIQNQLGADIIMAFDECPPLPCEPESLRIAVDRTVAWAARCKKAHQGRSPALYGIVQGGLDARLRLDCLTALTEIGFDGYAIGGLSVGEKNEEMLALLRETAHRLPDDRPRYLMGVGAPRDIVNAVAAGVDQFDCVLPTRNGRKGYAYTSAGVVRLRNSAHRLSCEPLDGSCDCYCCRNFSRAYLRHLIMSGELLGATLVSLHNVRFYQALMGRIRDAIDAGEFEQWRAAFLDDAGRATDEESSE